MRKIFFSFSSVQRMEVRQNPSAESGKKREEAWQSLEKREKKPCSPGAKYVCSQSTGCYSVPFLAC
jgi:hypothetical protein